MKKSIFFFTLIFSLFAIVYALLCIDGFYQRTFGKISDNWTRENDTPVLKHIPMTPPSNENAIQWDAAHYQRISKAGYAYDKGSAGHDYIFAFFPLFPLLWKILSLPPIGVMILNYILFVCAFLILQKLFGDSDRPDWLQGLLAWSLPSVIIFLIPYSEALFMFTVSVGLYGLVRKKYWIYFLGFFLAALCRPAYTFLFLSVFCVEVLNLCNHKVVFNFLKSLFFKTLPLIVGTLAVGMIQWFEHRESIFKFVEVQKYWNNVFQIPGKPADWSHEGFGINVGVVFMIAFPLLVFLLVYGIKQLKNYAGKQSLRTEYSLKDYIVLLSVFFTVGSFLFILLFRGGSLHCLFRFTLCTPFFYVLLIYGFDYVRNYNWLWRLIVLSVLALAGLLFLHKAEYSQYWNFSDFGFFVLCAAIFFWLLQDFYKSKLYRIGLMSVVAANLFWTAYLLNMYVNNGWIFA